MRSTVLLLPVLVLAACEREPLAPRNEGPGPALMASSDGAVAARFEQNFEGAPNEWSYSTVAWLTPEDLPAVQPDGPSGGFLRLAYEDVPGQVNGIALDPFAGAERGEAPVRWDATHLDLSFDFRMGGGNPNGDPSLGADGMSLALLNTQVAEYFGQRGIVPWPWWDPSGQPEEPNIAGSLGVGLDTWQNPYDPSNNHLSLHYEGSVIGIVDLSGTSLNLEDNQWHAAVLSVDFVSGVVRFSIDGQLYFDEAIAGLQPYPVRPAFYARTGPAFTNDHDLDSIHAVMTLARPRLAE